MIEIEPLYTQVQKAMQTIVGTVVLEDPSGFPFDESNLYCVGKNGETVWKAEKPEPSGLYNRVMLNMDGNTISAYAITGQACEIELGSGKLLNQAKIQ